MLLLYYFVSLRYPHGSCDNEKNWNQEVYIPSKQLSKFIDSTAVYLVPIIEKKTMRKDWPGYVKGITQRKDY